MRKGKYEYLREQYPEHISLDQLYRICRISKRSASYLVTNGIIPSTDTGRKTWRYHISLDDVITYLRRREQWGSMIPVGAVSSKNKKSENPRRSFAEYVERGAETKLSEYFEFIYSDYPDVLTVAEVAEMTGLYKGTILRYLSAGDIKKLNAASRFLIPKQYVMEFVISRKFIECKSNSEIFKKLLQGFELWIAKQKTGKFERSELNNE